MALAPDLIFRPLESPAQEAPNRRLANPGSGEEFSELLSKARTSQTEPLGTAPQEFALAQAAPPSLPLGAGLATLPEFSQDGLLSVSAASKPALAAQVTGVTGALLPGIESGDISADTRLVAPIQGGPEPADPGTLPEVTRTVAGDPDRIVPQTPAEAVSQAAAGRLADALPADRLPGFHGGPEPADPGTLPEVTRTIAGEPDRIVPQTPAEAVSQAATGRLETDRNAASSREAVPQIAAPAPANLENQGLADAVDFSEPDGSKPSALPTAIAPRMDAGASVGSSVPAKEIAASAASSRAGTATRTEKDVHRSFESGTQSEPAALASAPTSSFGIAAAALDVQTVSQPVAGAVPSVAASSPAIAPRNIAKPDSGQVSDTPSSGPSLPASETLEFADVLGTGEQLAASEAPGPSTQGAPALAAAASPPAAIQSSSISVAAPPVMAPANAILVASPADITSIVSNAADNGDADRIVIQLDPPELGRVSIDFKFDANGLQHVTVTGESREAMRQLRLMHFELTQALERHGITSQNMSFQQQQQNAQQSPTPNPFARQGNLSDAGGATALEPMTAHNNQTSPRMLPGGRLDMKL